MDINSDQFSLADFVTGKNSDIFQKTIVFAKFLNNVKKKHYTDPYLQRAISPSAGKIRIVNETIERELIQMNTANYLGLASHPDVVQSAHKALEQYGTGMGGVPLIAGTTDIHKELERALAHYKGVEDAVLFQTGYAANVGTIAALVGTQDWIVIDKQVHASILEGLGFTRARSSSFRHSDAKHLKNILERIRRNHKKGGILVIIESVYGIDGDVPPLPDIMPIVRRYDARLMVDECHATGVIGKDGAGLISHFHMTEPLDLVMDSLSKSLGSIGGWIGASKTVIDYLRYYAKPVVFSVGLSPVSAAAALTALRILEKTPQLVSQVQANAEFMREGLAAMGIENAKRSSSAIMSVVIGDEVKLRQITMELFQQGLWVEGIPYPAVPKGEERLRLRVTAKHTRQDLACALNLLENALRKYEVI
jgi:glycine C-acetyltransferase